MRILTSASMALLLGLGAMGATAPTASHAEVGVAISVGFAPPPLPIYEQPPIPGYGYIWTPGYWAWDPYYEDYYWVPGVWVLPPRIGLLWTPGWWGWNDGAYVFNEGYWGPVVGWYGGIDYGYGYVGHGYYGGEWRDGQFYYNRTVNNISNVNIRNAYSRPVAAPAGPARVSFNGPGGVQARPTPQELAARRAPHVAATPQQRQQIQVARHDPSLHATVNRGAPPIAATQRPGAFHGPGVVRASPASATWRPPPRPANAPRLPGAAAPARGGPSLARPEANRLGPPPEGAARAEHRGPNGLPAGGARNPAHEQARPQGPPPGAAREGMRQEAPPPREERPPPRAERAPPPREERALPPHEERAAPAMHESARPPPAPHEAPHPASPPPGMHPEAARPPPTAHAAPPPEHKDEHPH